MRAPTVVAAVLYGVLEAAAFVLVRRLRSGFPWLIGPRDETPHIAADLAKRHGEKSFDPDLGWCRRPGETGTERTTSGEVSFAVDARGRRRDPGFADLDAPAGVACFGDSFTFCRLVGDDETWPHHLSRRLGVNVANYGVGNYGLDQGLLRLERELDSLEADVVIMGVVPETIARIQSYWKHYFEYGNTLAFKPRFTLGRSGLEHHPSAVRDPSEYAGYQDQLDRIQRLDGFYRSKFRRDILRFPYLPRLARRWRRHLPLLAHLAAGRLTRDRDGAFQRAFNVVLRDNARWTARLYREPAAVRLLTALVERFAATCRDAGKQPLLLVMPQVVDLERADRGRVYGDVFAGMRRLLPVVDVTSRFTEAADPESLFSYGRLGPHPSDRGNALIADTLTPEVASMLARVRESAR
ncbi:SGNH/GDSL hydrolase family protein [Actinoallomurus iriomotensis]|uniref:SGNH/GDSL hydrolase family protein n=1 Tax=Actinoallomurus iriomotensis TaxID=478107 RepID=UPI002556438E|nr:hypothetical protein [Actinoallomurus iriomotensis]